MIIIYRKDTRHNIRVTGSYRKDPKELAYLWQA